MDSPLSQVRAAELWAVVFTDETRIKHRATELKPVLCSVAEMCLFSLIALPPPEELSFLFSKLSVL